MTKRLSFKYIKFPVNDFPFTAFLFFLFFFVCSPDLFAFQPQETNNLRWGELRQKIHSLNPLEHGAAEEQKIKELIFGKHLFETDPYNKELIPGIVESWTTFQDSLRWIVNIKDNIYFHDTTPVTSEDIKFSVDFYREYIRNSNILYNLQIDLIKEVEIIGNDYVHIEFAEKIQNLPLLLQDIPILSHLYYSADEYEMILGNVISKSPFGYGPYKVSGVISDDHIILDRHDNYYEGIPGFERISIGLYRSTNQLTADFITGRLDYIPVYFLDHSSEISRVDSSFKVFGEPNINEKMIFVNYNIADPLLRSLNIRKAISRAYYQILYPRAGLSFDVRSRASGPLPEDSWAFFRHRSKQRFSPAKAYEMIKTEGWDDTDRNGILERSGRDFRLELLFPEDDRYLEDLVRLIKTHLGEIGINIQERPLPYSELKERVRSSNFQMALDYSYHYPNDIIRTFFDIFDYYDNSFHRNRLGSRSAEAIRQMRRALMYKNQNQAKAIFERLQDIYYSSFTSHYLVREHHRFVAVNGNRIRNYMYNGILLSPAYWIPK